MKVGDVVKVLKSSGKYAGSPPFKDELVEITPQNINEIESHLRAGNMEMYKGKKSEPANVLSDSPKIGRRGSRGAVKPADDTEA